MQCANCGGSHSTDSNQYAQRHKAEIDARINKTIRNGKRKMVESTEKQDKAYDKASLLENARMVKTPKPERRKESLPIDTEIELKGENWAKGATTKFSFDISDKSRDHTPDYA